MLLRISFFLIALFFFSYGNVKIFATKAIENNSTLILKNPIIIYNDSIIQAKEGYVTNKRKIVLKKNVYISYKNNSIISADSIIAYSSKNIQMNDIFFYDKNMDGWVVSKYLTTKKNIFNFKKLFFSTCCIENPDWFMKANKASYNKSEKSLKLYNLVLVINKVPVFYLPYFYINFNKTRRSGLLRPLVGYSQNEGILYSQPIYFVTSINTDLEITPTIRTLRGKGVYSVFRFVDSYYSKGSIKAGIFYDNDNFYKNNNLAFKKHYGYSIKYERDKLFFQKASLYANLKYANDVDYFYLDAYNYRFNDIYLSDKLITSEINYIYNSESSLSGMYFKYFIDTTKINNNQTWQILPQFNYHIYLNDKFGFKNMVDLNVYNYYRREGSNFVLFDILTPISLNYDFFDDYLKLKITELLNAGYGFYYQKNSLNSKYLNLSTQLKIYTSLTKNNSFLHIISPSLLLNIKNVSKSEIYTDLMSVPNLQNYISFNLFQIFEKNNFKFTHTLNEIYYLDLQKFADLENILNVSFYNFIIEENNKYSLNDGVVKYNNIKISYNNNPFYIFVSHVFQKNVSEAITYGLQYEASKFKTLYAEYNYDIMNKYGKYWLFGVKSDKKCWKYDLSFKQARIPIMEENGISYKKDNILSINFELRPIGGLNQTFVFKGK